MKKSEEKTAEYLTELLETKDEEIRDLKQQLDQLECHLRNSEAGWSVHRQERTHLTLPAPRLEIEGRMVDEYHLLWEYRFVYPHLLGHNVIVPLGRTESSGNFNERRRPPRNQDGSMDLPYRDGAHIHHDMEALKLPAYAIWKEEGKNTIVEELPFRDKYENQLRVGRERRGKT